ncbi:hypothetical protein K2173_012107 [Erythroxylum novogranatense]|uniref:Phthiocerol/phthiodiolone dimycocerosyl transferase C-terminal domain-containing protein n=1 Tax=Erythroxylum novogranatense TaxID=1862640 RepID=A0AAV8SRM7_9ROSI|nr:hypothetical protein K2173_012107 [Erythroxylum novogranatense]
MSDETNESPARQVGGTEYSWCKAVPGGTGITVLALLLSKPPEVPLLQDSLHSLQNAHAILRSKIRLDSTTNTFSFVTPASNRLQIQHFDISSTEAVFSVNDNDSVGAYHAVLEHELNRNVWSSSDTDTDTDVFFASLYTISEAKWAVALRLHTGACDRTSAVSLLRELLSLMGREDGGEKQENEKEDEVSLGIESLIPRDKANKPFWARGIDVLGYSLNSLRLSNLNFVDTYSPRVSQVVRLRMSRDETQRLLAGCKSRGIKLCGAMAAAGLMAAYSSKGLPRHQRQKYGVVTLVDCRSILEPALSPGHLGFYHSAILNTHDISGDEKLWDLAKRCYTALENAKSNNKHFTDMDDLNFLMCKAIDNPALTPSSSLRTALITVFEESVIDEPNAMYGKLGIEDYVGCASVHGVGPSVAVFDTICDGQLDSACVYPSPLFSRVQMQKLIDDMKAILADG